MSKITTAVREHEVPVELVVVGEHHDHVGRLELGTRELDVWTDRDRAGPDERIHDPQVGAEGRQQLGDAYGRRFASVAGVLLVGLADQQQASALDRRALPR